MQEQEDQKQASKPFPGYCSCLLLLTYCSCLLLLSTAPDLLLLTYCSCLLLLSPAPASCSCLLLLPPVTLVPKEGLKPSTSGL